MVHLLDDQPHLVRLGRTCSDRHADTNTDANTNTNTNTGTNTDADTNAADTDTDTDTNADANHESDHNHFRRNPDRQRREQVDADLRRCREREWDGGA